MSQTPDRQTKDRDTARALIACLDLTNLNEDCTEGDVATLCERAPTPEGEVAAICIWPRFVAFARKSLAPGIRIATVVNFPEGGEDVEATVAETKAAVSDGADEIDMVIAYARVAADPGFVTDQVRRVKAAAGPARVKTILETGELGDARLIRSACEAALAGGADFLKTSTGKRPISATPQAAEILLTAIAEAGGTVGFKPAGGVKTFEDAKAYRDLATRICGPDYVVPERFRIGASSVLDDLLAVAGGGERSSGAGFY